MAKITELSKRDSNIKLTFRKVTQAKNGSGAPASLDEDTRSVEVIGATETPAQVYDWQRGQVVNEVLLMSGLEIPSNRQIPLIDSHMRYSTNAVLGSYREMAIEGDKLVGRAFFSAVPEAESPYIKVREGHLTDFSIGYRVIDSEWVPAGETRKIKGRSFKGPVKVTTRFRAKELSVVPIGADEQAKARAELSHQTKPQKTEAKKMNERLRKLLEARGLSPDATEDEAWAFLVENPLPSRSAGGGNEPGPGAGGASTTDANEVRATAAAEERQRIAEINAMCEPRSVPDDMRQGFIDNATSVDTARAAVMQWELENNQTAGGMGHRSPIENIADEVDKFRAAAQHALYMRADIPGVKIENLAAGAEDLRGWTLVEVARHVLRLHNLPTGGHKRQMIDRAMTTDDFPHLLSNVANKALQAGWESADETWSVWVGTGSVSDFKIHTAARASETDDLLEVPEHGEYKYGERSETFEQYQVLTFGRMFALTRQTIINDDLGGLTDTPFQHGESASRKLGDLVYAVLTANAAMGDGVALFAVVRGNLQESGSPVGIASVGAGVLAMKSQKDIKGKRRLNIRPRFYIGPVATEGAAEVFFKSEKFADSNTVATDSSLAATRANPYAGGYITRVYESRLDDDSETAWYLAGPKGKTVKLFFLDGIKTPYMETKKGWSVDGMEYKVRIDAGAKAMMHEGLYKDPGQ